MQFIIVCIVVYSKPFLFHSLFFSGERATRSPSFSLSHTFGIYYSGCRGKSTRSLSYPRIRHQGLIFIWIFNELDVYLKSYIFYNLKEQNIIPYSFCVRVCVRARASVCVQEWGAKGGEKNVYHFVCACSHHVRETLSSIIYKSKINSVYVLDENMFAYIHIYLRFSLIQSEPNYIHFSVFFLLLLLSSGEKKANEPLFGTAMWLSVGWLRATLLLFSVYTSAMQSATQ